MGCGASDSRVADPRDYPDPLSGDGTVEVQVKGRGDLKILTADGKRWMMLGHQDYAALEDFFYGESELWEDPDGTINAMPVDPNTLRLALWSKNRSAGCQVIFTRGAITEWHEIGELSPKNGIWPGDPEGRWESTPQCSTDFFRYSWRGGREITLSDCGGQNPDDAGEGTPFASLKVSISGFTRVLTAYDPEGTGSTEENHRCLVMELGGGLRECYPVMGMVTIELVKEGGGSVPVDTGTDGWNEVASAMGRQVDKLPVELSPAAQNWKAGPAQFGAPKMEKEFSCELFRARMTAPYEARITAKPGVPGVQAITLAALMGSAMHPSKLMQSLNSRVKERVLIDSPIVMQSEARSERSGSKGDGNSFKPQVS